jgi:hypothetical protein
MASNTYSAAEEAALRSLYPTATKAELLAAIPNRKWDDLRKSASRRKLQRPRVEPSFIWEGYPLEQLHARYVQEGAMQLAVDLRLPVGAVRQKAAQQGLRHYSGLANRPPCKKAVRASEAAARQARLKKLHPGIVTSRPKAEKPVKVKPPQPVKEPTQKPLAVKGAAGSGTPGTPLLNARKDQRLREERKQAKSFSITAALQALPPDSEGRRVYTIAARQGGQAGITAFLDWKQQQAA